ncbi:MAG: AtpZ/AtpI family protein [Deltaproteobacteria bacterium]|nr:AtpZ/AtpI family protein [Deltaproteobacteria bacterium]
MNSFRKKTIVGRIITYSSIGIQIGFAIAIGVIAGVYLDQWLSTAPWLTLLGLLIGLVSGFARLYQIGKEFGNNNHREHRDSKGK